jgi:hypothetical protein
MSGHDDTFVPPEREDGTAPPYPPRHAPPHFGRGPAGQPSAAYQAAGTQGAGAVPGSSVASDAEETMTPPLHRNGDPPSETQPPGSAPYGAPPPSGARPPHGHFTAEPPVPEAERTVTDEPAPDAETGHSGTGTPAGTHAGRSAPFVNGQATLALARLGTGDSTGTATGPELEPDAILPPGISPEAPPEPPLDPHATSTGPIPRLGAGPGFPGGTAGASGARRALLVAAGLVAALLLGGGGALAVTQLSGGSGHHAAPQPPAPTPVAPTPTPSPSRTKAKHKPKHVPVDIRDEKTDPKQLTIGEVFPHKTLKLAGHTFVRSKTVINDHCALAANGPFATELTREHCRRVVRATYVSTDKKLAVTTGIAVMPTDAAARAMLKVQDPSHYEWFRGMKATGAPKIDRPGGYATSTMRGRYISYAYAMYVDAHKPTKGDDTLKAAGTAFRDAAIRPIERRDKKH